LFNALPLLDHVEFTQLIKCTTNSLARDFRKYTINDEDTKQYPHITSLRLNACSLSQNFLLALATILKNPFCTLKKLDLGDCDLTSKDLFIIGDALKQNTSLTAISLASNVNIVKYTHIPLFMNAVATHPALRC